MTIEEAIHRARLLVEEYRGRSLWFLREDYSPTTVEETLGVLNLIERYGDRAAYLKVHELKRWLLPSSSPTS